MSKEEFKPMSKKQSRIFIETAANVEAALGKVDPELANRIREQQHDVAETRRRAQSNPDMLNIRIGKISTEGARE
jgi:hypothetical protein